MKKTKKEDSKKKEKQVILKDILLPHESNEFDDAMEVYLKPEFNIFEEHYWLKCRKEGKKFTGTVSDYYFTYLAAMEVTSMEQLLNTDINLLLKKSIRKYFHPGPSKIYGINNVIHTNLGRNLLGIENYIPVPDKTLKELEKNNISKLSDCLNINADSLLKVKGIGYKTIEGIEWALKTFHNKALDKSTKFINNEERRKNIESDENYKTFYSVFNTYKDKGRLTKHDINALKELEKLLTKKIVLNSKKDCLKSIYALEFLSSKIRTNNVIRKFSNYQKTVILRRHLDMFIKTNFGYQGVYPGNNYVKYWERFGDDLFYNTKEIIDALSEINFFGNYNPLTVYFLLTTYPIDLLYFKSMGDYRIKETLLSKEKLIELYKKRKYPQQHIDKLEQEIELLIIENEKNHTKNT